MTAGSEENMDLENLIDEIGSADGEDKVSLDAVLDKIGRRSFGPVLLLAGLVMVAPIIGDIPGVPVIMGILMFLFAAQLLFRHDDHFWVPQWLLRHSVSRDKLDKGLRKVRRPAGFVDRLLRPRLRQLTGRTGTYAIAACCLLISLSTPFLEFVPFSANAVGIAVVAFGLALMAQDGLFALIGIVFAVGTLGAAAFALI